MLIRTRATTLDGLRKNSRKASRRGEVGFRILAIFYPSFTRGSATL
jgi:hypothetical protein